tara:strand:+ start:19090 stop:20508 length:1419 start_codon:yes stop_codon:yes gene_type:complete
MSITLTKDVLYKEMPAGTDWTFTILSSNISGNYKFKYIADLYIDTTGAASTMVARLKFSPNEGDYGIINLSEILQQYVSPDHKPSASTSFKGGAYNATSFQFPLHVMDKASQSVNIARRLTIKWGEEYSGNATDSPTIYANELTSSDYLFWNGVAYNNEGFEDDFEYGIDITNWNSKDFIPENSSACFLTDAPNDRQYIGDDEYATLAFFNGYLKSHSKGSDATHVAIEVYDAGNSLISGDSYDIDLDHASTHLGTGDSDLTNSGKHILYAGVGTANLRQVKGGALDSSWSYYDVYLTSDTSANTQESKKYRYYKRSADCKGYEKIRLVWLNKYGAWDYYTFTKKTLRESNIAREYYNKVKGDWSTVYSKYDWDRGLGVLNTQVIEKATLNSDWFYSDDEAAWMEQLFISPEVYIIEDFQSANLGTGAWYGKYLTPVVVTSNRYDIYTRANDKLAQYIIDIEYSHNKKVQKA